MLHSPAQLLRPVQLRDQEITARATDKLIFFETPSRSWFDQAPAPNPAAPAFEAADQIAIVHVNELDVELPLTYISAVALMRDVYILDGRDGAQQVAFPPLEPLEAMVTATVGVSPPDPADTYAGADEGEPQSEPDLAALRLLRLALAELDERRAAAVDALQPVIRDIALKRLEQARIEILDEFNRYFGTGQPVVFKYRFQDATSHLSSALVNNITLLGRSIVLEELLRAIERLQPLAREIRSLESARRVVPQAGLEGKFRSPAERAEQRDVLERIGTRLQQAQHRLAELRISAGAEFPVLWKVWDPASPDALSVSELAEQVLDALRASWEANLWLASRLRKEPELVWDFPTLIDGALDEEAVPTFCIASVAARERLFTARENERAIRQAAMISGVAALGVALAGAAVAPPVAVAVLVADAIASLADAVVEYRQYQRTSRAFDACLDPRHAIAAEPSFVASAMVIALDLVSVVPVRVRPRNE